MWLFLLCDVFSLQVDRIQGWVRKRLVDSVSPLHSSSKGAPVTFLWLVIGRWVHISLLSVCWTGGRRVLPLNYPWNVSEYVPAKVLHRDQYYTNTFICCYQVETKAIRATKMSLYFPVVSVQRRLCPMLVLRRWWVWGLGVLGCCLPFSPVSQFDIHHFSFLCMKGSCIVTEMTHSSKQSLIILFVS